MKAWVRMAVFGILAFLAFSAVFAPARLLATLVERIDGASLTGTAGTVWRGSGRLHLLGQERGRITWSFRPTTLLELFPGFSWTLTGEHLDLGGNLNLAPARTALSATGSMEAAAVNPWLAKYNLFMAGNFHASNLYLHIRDSKPDDLRGTIRWSGGRLRYVLSHRPRTVSLPPLHASLSIGEAPAATVFAEGGTTPLLEAELLDNGFAKIGITMLLTKLLNEPWPGGGADHEVVLAVEEKIL